MKKKINVPRLLGQSDLTQRWGITRQGLTWRAKNHKDFPTPALYVHNGKTALYYIGDVIDYERAHKMNIEPEEKPDVPPGQLHMDEEGNVVTDAGEKINE